ncbi:MAG: bifunctional isocitrate dehydrogenase kinase/phosphatase [Acidobacteriia bacterium]|nr:bifunctional isocitrate dehydrogenase kinase/phosphatase [Terriglobia bacterium]
MRWPKLALDQVRAARARHRAWRRLFPAGQESQAEDLSIEEWADARRAAELIANSHRGYFSKFNSLTAEAQEIFEEQAWVQAALNAERRVRLYREAVDSTWHKMQRLFPERLLERRFWMAARRAFLERVFNDYEADLALTYFYSVMRLAFDQKDTPVEYADDGLAQQSHIWNPRPVWEVYEATPKQMSRSVIRMLRNCGFRARFENPEGDADLVTARLLDGWGRQIADSSPRHLRMLRPVFYRDREAYLVGELMSRRRKLPVVLALRHEEAGIRVDAVLTGKEDMRNILFISTRSTFHVHNDNYREVLTFLDTLAPERGHPAMCAVLGFTHPARVALNQRLRRHLRETGERFSRTPGRAGMAMVVFAPPSFPYVFKVIRDFSSKTGWTGRTRIMDLYRWVHEINRGRLMLDAWLYRNLDFPRRHFDDGVVQELLESAPNSVRIEGDRIILKHVYAQRRVQPLNTFFDETRDRALRERVIDALGTFIKDLAGMGFFVGDCYGLTFNTGLTHGFNVALFDFDDLGPLFRYRFRETPQLPTEQDEFLWNTEIDGAWFAVDEFDVLVDEWERFLGVPPDLRDYFRRRHGDLFTIGYWVDAQRRLAAGEFHYALPYPPERCLANRSARRPPPNQMRLV